MRRFERSSSLPDGDPVAAEAAAWVARHHLRTIDPAAFEQWRSRDVRHALAFARALATWERASAGAAAAPIAPLQQRQLASGARRQFLRAAAVVATAGLCTSGIWATRAYAWSSDSTAIGENKRIRLPDGSIAMLNTDSGIAWRFSATARDLRIDRGEVALDLRPGPELVVRGDGRAIYLRQGRFDVRRRDAALDLLVLSGQVRVAPGASGHGATSIDASAGQASILVSREDATMRAVNAEQIDGITAWQRSEILFRDATLGSAVEEYNRFLTRKIVIVDRELAAIPVGGRFTTTDPSAFLHAISAGLNIRVSRSANAYLLTR